MGYCSGCGAMVTADRCERHPGEPILDPSNPDSRVYIEQDRDARHSRLQSRLELAGGLAGAVACLLALLLVLTPLAPLVVVAYGIGLVATAVPLTAEFAPVEVRSGLNPLEQLDQVRTMRVGTSGFVRWVLPVWPVLLGVTLGSWLARRRYPPL